MRINRKKKILRILNDQKGMASILITLITMIVISLIVLGFAQITQREQRSALDRQLNNQAQYAAQSGVNDAADIIDQYLQNDQAVPSKTTCQSDVSNPSLVYNQLYSGSYTTNSNYYILNSSGNVEYTCLLVNPKPNNLLKDPVPEGQAWIAQVQSGNSSPLGALAISWENKQVPNPGTFNCGSGGSYTEFPPKSNWACSAGVLRIDIVPMDNVNSDLVLFLHPQPGGGYTTKDYTTLNSGQIIPVNCGTGSLSIAMPYYCNIGITNMPGDVYLRVKAIYNDQNVMLTGFSGVSANSDLAGCSNTTCNSIPLKNDQALVDSTGKAQDVLQRIQARVPINPLEGNIVPDSAIQSTNSICKQFEVLKNNTNTSWLTQDDSSCSNFFSP